MESRKETTRQRNALQIDHQPQQPSSFSKINPRSIMPGFDTNDVGSKTQYFTKLAVSFTVKGAQHWTVDEIRSSLNRRLSPNPNKPKPVVICRLMEQKQNGTEFYVELRTPDELDELLRLNGVKIESIHQGMDIWPTIEPWDRFRMDSSRKNHQYHESRDGDENARPSKRPRIPTLESPSSKKNVLNLDKNNDCRVFLTKNPPSYTPKSFQVYLNNYIRQTKMIGICNDKPPIVRCYESSTPNTRDGWILEAQTAKIAASLINHLSGKLLLEGTRLYFLGSNNILRTSPNIPIASPMKAREWREDCKVFLTDDSCSMDGREVSSFINTFMRKSKLFDCDVVVNWKFLKKIKQYNLILFLCISADAAQKIVTELDGVPHEGNKMRLKRHNLFQKRQWDIPADDISSNNKNRTNSSMDIASKKNVTTINNRDSSNTSSNTSTTMTSAHNSSTTPSMTGGHDSSNTPSKTFAAMAGADESPKTSATISGGHMPPTTSSKTPTTIAGGRSSSNTSSKTSAAILGGQKSSNTSATTAGAQESSKISSKTSETAMDGSDFSKTSSPPTDTEIVKLKAQNEKHAKKISQLLIQNKKLSKEKKDLEDQNADYLKKIHQIHESWQEQSAQVEEQKKAIKDLKDRLEKEAEEKEKVKSELEEKKVKYQEMTDALTSNALVIQEEQAVRKQMALSLVEMRKGRKQAEKKLKNYLRNLEVKDEDEYDA